MERLSDAVLGYALRHRTPGVGITMVDDDGMPVQTGFYAAGRPYLPCPDGNHDGIEDRRDLISPVVQTLSRSFLRTTPRGVFFGGFPETDEVPIIYNGLCFTNKGQLPWRTLGSIPADYWGNRYTYFADPVFSQEAIGFDEKTIADAGLRSLPRVLTTNGVPIPQKRSNDTTVGTPIGGRVLFGPPSVICDVAQADRNSPNCGRDFRSGTVPSPPPSSPASQCRETAIRRFCAPATSPTACLS